MNLARAALVALSLGTLCLGSVDARELTLEQRISAQRAIEEVYWRHRIWPAGSRRGKPALDEVLPETALRDKVETYLQESNALEVLWERPIGAAELQAEIERMASATRDAAVLHELFAVLGDDAFLIAETLARPLLVERRIRDAYASDPRFHGEVQRKAQEAFAACASLACMKTMGGEYRERTLRLRDERGGAFASLPEDELLALEPDAWERDLERLARKVGGAPRALPLGRPSALEETPEGFAVTSVLTQRSGVVTSASVFWPKRSFDSWWSEERAAFGVSLASPVGSFSLPQATTSGCVNDSWSPTSFETPDPRSYHTAVWTGSEMIVWGGFNGRSVFNTGARYDPVTDTWTPTAMTNVPSARELHTALWTGTEMIVWGGTDGNFPIRSGGRYNPMSDTWAPTSLGSGVPTERSYHTAVWTGTRMIVWGGSGAGAYFASGGLYDPSSDTWTPTSSGANLPMPRALHSAVWTGTEMIVWGGDNGGPLNTGARYDPSTNTWSATSLGTDLPAARYYHTAVWTGSEMIVWGGTTGSVQNTGSRYDPATDTWKVTAVVPDTPTGRSYHAAIWTGSEMIVWGGWSGSGYFSTGGRYDPGADTWLATKTGGAPAARELQTAVWTGTEMIVWGGTSGVVLNTGGRYAPASDSWKGTSSGATVASARAYHTAVWTGAEMIVWGGDDGLALTNTGSRYSPATDSWTPTSIGVKVPLARYQHTALWTGTEMILWGGWSSGYLASGGRYSPLTDTWAPTSTGANDPVARYFHTSVWDAADELMIIWGGYNAGALNSGGRYAPATDTWTATSNGPGVPVGRFRHSAVFTGSELIVWGGLTPGYVNNGARYNPATDTWSATPLAGAPTPRAYQSAIWSGTEMIVWGGSDGSFLRTGGRYRPASGTWTPTSIGANAPSARMFHSAVWTGNEMIVWGGLGGGSGYFQSGGRYDPSLDLWTPTSTGSNVPAVRDYHSAVWAGTRMIVWGGQGGNGYLCSGGAYCACLAPVTYYRDADGDGYGVASDSVVSCSQPSGYVGTLGDCDDADPATYPHAPEVKDGRDNQCPEDCPGGECGFGTIDEISGSLRWNGASLCWPAQPGAFEYQLVRSPGPAFTSGCLVFPSTSASCLGDPATPGAGNGFSYLVRAAGPSPPGSFGQKSGGAERTGGCLPP